MSGSKYDIRRIALVAPKSYNVKGLATATFGVFYF